MRSVHHHRGARGPATRAPAPARCRPSAVRPVVASAAGGFVDASRQLVSASVCPYRVLGVALGTATEDEIKAAYRRKAREYHPDVCKDPLAHLSFMECQSAYQTLLNPEKRAQYDRSLLPRASSQVLSYLNARSAARHGVVSGPSRAPVDRELHTTMLELLQQVKRYTKHVEREFLGRDGRGRGRAAGSSHPSSQVAAPVPVEAHDCGDHGEGCEPWLYYAAAASSTSSNEGSRRRA